MSESNPQAQDIIDRIAAYAVQADPKALVIPTWLAIEEGQNADELRSALDETDASELGRIHAVMIDRTAPGTRKYAVENVPFELDDDEGEAAGQRLYELGWTFKVGVFYGYERRPDADSSSKAAKAIFDAIADKLSLHRKLGLSFVIDHGDLQIARSYPYPFDQDLVHVEIGTIVVRLHKRLPAPEEP